MHSIGQKKGGRSHAYLFEHGGELTLVDTLFDDHAEPVLECIRAISHSPSNLKHIALTHGHRSHLGGLASLKRAARWSTPTNGKLTSSPASAWPSG